MYILILAQKSILPLQSGLKSGVILKIDAERNLLYFNPTVFLKGDF